MTTLTVKKPSTTTRTHAPIVGIHLPIENDRIAADTPNQMNASAKTYFAAPWSGVKNSPNVAAAVIVSEPPSQIGLDSQYRTELIAAEKRPKASFTQTYG